MPTYNGCPSGLTRYKTKRDAEKAEPGAECKFCWRCHGGWHAKRKGRRRAERQARRSR